MQLSVSQYAILIGVSRRRVIQQIDEGKLSEGVTAQKIGKYYVITLPRAIELKPKGKSEKVNKDMEA
jgi:hypothetical protein